MTAFKFNYLGNYANHGQDAEQSVRYALTQKIYKADNIPYTQDADCLNFQIKSARATVCKGTNLEAYLALDACSAYIYATAAGIAYVMSKEEYTEFCKLFGTVTRESSKNGGSEKLRLKHEGKTLLGWLQARV